MLTIQPTGRILVPSRTIITEPRVVKSSVFLDWMRDCTNARRYKSLVDTIFSIRDNIGTVCQVTYQGFSAETFPMNTEFAVMFMKPCTHVNGNFTQGNTMNIINRLAEAGWFPRAVRIFKGSHLPTKMVINNYPDPFSGSTEDVSGHAYLSLSDNDKCKPGPERLAMPGKEGTMLKWSVAIYGDAIKRLPFIHSFDLVDPKEIFQDDPHQSKTVTGRFPMKFVTALWKKGYQRFEKDDPLGINLVPFEDTSSHKCARNPKTRIFWASRETIDQVLDELGYPESIKRRIISDLIELGLYNNGFVMCNGFAVELLQSLKRERELIPVLLIQKGTGEPVADDNMKKLRADVIGKTNPAIAKRGTIRGDAYLRFLGNRGIPNPILIPDVVEVNNNVVHTSDNHENACREFKVWFGGSLFTTVLSGSRYPIEQIEDMEAHSIVGASASKISIPDIVLTSGISAGSNANLSVYDIFPPIREATISYRRWKELRDRYSPDDVNTTSHKVAKGGLTNPEVDGANMIEYKETGLRSGVKEPVVDVAGAAGQNQRYFASNVPESLRCKAAVKIKEVNMSPIELRINEILNRIKRGEQPVIPLFLTNNYNHAYVRDHVKLYLEKIMGQEKETLKKLYSMLKKGKDKTEPKDIVADILDEIVTQSGSLPRMVPNSVDLRANPAYARDHLVKWARFLAPIHYFSNECLQHDGNKMLTPFSHMDGAQYAAATEELMKLGLICITMEEIRFVGESENIDDTGIFQWKLTTLCSTEKEFDSTIAKLHDKKVVKQAWTEVREHIWNSRVRAAIGRERFQGKAAGLARQVMELAFNKDKTFWSEAVLSPKPDAVDKLEEIRKQLDEAGISRNDAKKISDLIVMLTDALQSARGHLFPEGEYVFERYLSRSSTDIIDEKGNPGDYCFDRDMNVTCKSPGHMDLLTYYALERMAGDMRNGRKVAFASCAEDFAVKITDQLVDTVKFSPRPFTFLVNRIKDPSGLKGGFIFCPVDPKTGTRMFPRIYEKFQFDGKLPQNGDFFFNLFQVGLNLEGLASYLFGPAKQGFINGAMSKEEIREYLWSRIYSRLDPIVEVRAVDQGTIWAAQFVYILGQVSHLCDDKGEPLSRFIVGNFPFVQIKVREHMKQARAYWKANTRRYDLGAK